MNIDQLVEMTELQNKRQIEKINEIFPELTINLTANMTREGCYHYYFRCLTSEDDTDGFDTPVQALAHFAKRLAEEADTYDEYDVDGHSYELIVPREA